MRASQLVPKGAPRPRRAVLDMAPYSPPTGDRLGKLRLDFNENTVGCSPRIVEFLKYKLLAAISPATKAVLIANPNNPTGTGVPLAGIEKILKRARRAAVLIDEAYFEFCGVTALGLINDFPNLFVSRTFSKVYGMAAMRL